MNNELKKILPINYKTIEKVDSVEIFHINYGTIEQEVYIKCKKSALGWTIFKIVRDSNFEIGTFIEEEYAICVVYVLCMKNFEEVKVNNNLKRSLRNCDGDNAKFQANEIIESECESKYFSLYKPKKNSICMENINELYNVFYLCEDNSRVDIVSDATFNRAIVVVYNFSILLKEFNKIYEQLIKHYPICKNHYEKLFRYYLNK